MRTRPEARAWLEARFARIVEWDVTPAGREVDAGWAEAAATVTRLLWARFSFDWPAVQPNPGGTAGHHSAFLQAKLAWAQAVAERAPGAELAALETACTCALNVLWREWAGYQVTARDDLALAVDPEV